MHKKSYCKEYSDITHTRNRHVKQTFKVKKYVLTYHLTKRHYAVLILNLNRVIFGYIHVMRTHHKVRIIILYFFFYISVEYSCNRYILQRRIFIL